MLAKNVAGMLQLLLPSSVEASLGDWALGVQETGNRALPKPGDYIVQYSATMLNRGGQQYHRTITSAEFKYRAASGPADVCDLSGWPDKIQLGTIPTDMQLCLRDGSGNYTRAAITSVKLSSDHLDVTCEDGQWGHTAEGHDALQLAAVVLKPRDTFQPLGADKAVKCDVKLHVVLDRGHELTADYKLDVFTGRAALLCLKHLHVQAVMRSLKASLRDSQFADVVSLMHLDACTHTHAQKHTQLLLKLGKAILKLHCSQSALVTRV